MGFFTDLKQDLSQAVDEMADGENKENADTSELQNENADIEDTSVASEQNTEQQSNIDDVDLAAMLDKVAGNGEAVDSALDEEKNEDSPDIPSEVMGDGISEAGDSTGTENESVTGQEDQNIEQSTEEQNFAEKINEEKSLNEQNGQDDNSYVTNVETADESRKSPFFDLKKDKVNNKKGKEKMNDASEEKMTPVDETASVTAGMTINGDIKSAGSLDLIGMIAGNIDILGKLNVTGSITGDSKASEIYAEGAKITGELHSNGSVKIGQSTVVIGNVFATSAVIAGAVKGDIDVQGPVILDTSAIVMGNIKSKSVQINNGAVIEGMCSQCYADVNPSSFFEEFKKK